MSMTVAQQLKGSGDHPRWSCRARCNGQEVLLKVRSLTTLRPRWRATLGRAYFKREAVMLQRVADAGVSVPVLVGRGACVSFGLATRQALMTQWLTGYQPLEEWLSHDAGRTLASMAAMLDQVRRAHLADKDFGVHNILAAEQDGQLHIVWADLERASPARADDADSTCQTVGAALVRWGIAMKGNPSSLENA